MDTEPDRALTIAPGTIQIAVATDDGYASHLTVMLMSLFEQHAGHHVHVHAMVPNGFRSKEKISGPLGGNAKYITFHDVDAASVAHLKQRDDISNATYYRLLMGEILPPSLDRVIYLDCDMLICGSVAPLWVTQLGPAIVGAVSDPAFFSHEVLGFARGDKYFNAGMLLVDLHSWRAGFVGKAALDFASANPARLTFNDQCALNWILRGRWLELPPVWNLQAYMIGDMKRGYFSYPKSLRKNANGARIVHFNAPGRPWHYLDEHPFKSRYLTLRARTAWANEPLLDQYPHNIIVKSLRRQAPFLLPAYLQLRKYI